MGMPALRRQPRQQASRPRLRVVSARERTPRTRARASSSPVRTPLTPGGQAFTAFMLCLTVVTALGVGRVWLSAASAATSLASSELRAEIKQARYEGDMLEVQQSALSAPSRVRALAGEELALSEPASVCYLGIGGDVTCEPSGTEGPAAVEPQATPTDEPAVGAGPQAAPEPQQDGMQAIVAKMMDVAAGEAQVLLVGDVGLASP